MSATTFAGNVLVILVAMALLALLELAIPLFVRPEARRGRIPANLGLTALTFVLNWALTSAAGMAALSMSFHDQGLLRKFELSLPACIVVALVTLDGATYVAHRLMHAIPPLWGFHRVHHSDPFLDVTSSFRQHPLEGGWRFLWILIPTLVLGLPAEAVVIYRLASAIQALFEHANVRVWSPVDRALSLFWCTPNMHKIHHSRERAQTDSNYGNIFAFFDRAFRTFRRTDEAHDLDYGLASVSPERAKSLRMLVAMPFSRGA